MPHLRLHAMINPSRGGLPVAGDFEGAILYSATPAILSALIPAGTLDSYVNGPRTTMGFKYEWLNAGEQWVVWGHDPVAGAPAGTTSATEWTFRVKKGNLFLTPVGIGTGIGNLGPPTRWLNGRHAENTHILLEHN